jgi:hypothetical protein
MIRLLRHAKKGRTNTRMSEPSAEGWAAAEARRTEVKTRLSVYAPLRQDVDDHVQTLMPYIAHAWDTHDPAKGSSWEVWGIMPVYWHLGKLIAKAVNRGLKLPKAERKRRAEMGEPVRFMSTDAHRPGLEIRVGAIPASTPADPTIAEITLILRRWLSERRASTNAERAALEVMTARANGDDEISLAAAGRRYKLSRERVRQVYLQLEADFRDAHPELKELLREAA